MQNILNKVKKGSIITLVVIGASSIVLTVYRIWIGRRIRVQLEDGNHEPVNE